MKYKVDTVPTLEEVIEEAEKEFDLSDQTLSQLYTSWKPAYLKEYYEEVADFMLGNTKYECLDWEGIEYYVNEAHEIDEVNDGWMIEAHRGKVTESTVLRAMAYYVYSNFIDEGTPMYMKEQREILG
jgi:hypothetical protein